MNFDMNEGIEYFNIKVQRSAKLHNYNVPTFWHIVVHCRYIVGTM